MATSGPSEMPFTSDNGNGANANQIAEKAGTKMTDTTEDTQSVKPRNPFSVPQQSEGPELPPLQEELPLQQRQPLMPVADETIVQGRERYLAEDDDMGEASDFFEDEPVETETMPAASSPKRGRRSKTKTSSVYFSKDKKSYWSSDDDSSIRNSKRMVNVRNRSSKLHSNKVPNASPLPSVEGRKRNIRSKRRIRRGQEDDDGSSCSDVEARHPQRRMSPPLTKNSPKPSPKPPVAVVRTKGSGKANKNSPIPRISNHQKASTTTTNTPLGNALPRIIASPAIQHLSIEDMEICQRLDDEYENALEERHVGYMARYTSVRQSACFSVGFMLLFLGLGTTFFTRYADWAIHDALLFCIYTITTVGYGNHAIPKETGFQCFTILYIFVGIATLTIMVAQVYQCIALEASRAQHSRDETEMNSRGLGQDILSRRSISSQQRDHNIRVQSSGATATSCVSHEPPAVVFIEDWAIYDFVANYYEKARHFFTYNEYGRSFSVLLPFAGLILIGAVVVGPLEDWNVVESLYFAVVSLTTVGFGDYYPRHIISIWFCILWLPFSVGFMSLFLKNVATFYIRLSAKNITRIERRMRRRVARAKEKFEFERSEALRRAYHGQIQATEQELQSFPSADSDDVADHYKTPTKSLMLESSAQRHAMNAGPVNPADRRYGRNSQFDALPTNPEDLAKAAPLVQPSRASLFGSPGEDSSVINRRERILQNSLGGHQEDNRPTGQTMDTMKDVIRAVHKSIKSGSSDSRYLSMRSSVMKPVLGDSNEPMKKPSFALRALVQERFAEIIATDIAGFQSSIEIKDNTLSVTIDRLKDTADKWCVPRRARKAFRAVAFEALYFVGEHGLITRGADALYALSPFEFHGLFSPLLAALGDAGTMEDWLATTEVLAEYDLKKEANNNGSGDVEMGERGLSRTTAERLHTATHRSRTEPSDDFCRVTAANFLSS